MNSYQFEYDRTYTPPAPVITVILHGEEGESAPLPAFLDSGADATIIPIAILKKIGARYANEKQLVGSTGQRVKVRLFSIFIQIGTDNVYGIEAVGYGKEVVLGRDVLNQITVILEGPLQFCDLRI